MRRRILGKVLPKRAARANLVAADTNVTTETQSSALDNARITFLRAAEIVVSGKTMSELQAAGQAALEVLDCVKVS